MMDFIWAGIMIVSVLCGIATGNISALSDAAISGANRAIEVALGFAGVMIFWTGIMRIAEKAGVTTLFGRMCAPLLKLLFRGIDVNSKKARYISMNIAANFLGLGNAATPFGLEAMKEMQKDNIVSPETASKHMITFVVINTAGIQLVPTTIAALRAKYDSLNPMEIMPSVWIASVLSMIVGLMVNYIFSKSERQRDI